MQRTRWDILAAILRAAKRPESKTHIMYRSNLSYRQLERYLAALLAKNLLKVSEERHSKATKLFVTTERGLSFLNAYRTLEEFIREEEP